MSKVQELREERGLTRKDLAEDLQVSKNTVESWENGRRFPNRKTVKKLAELFEVEAKEFYA